MPRVITDDCIACSSCAGECPVECISDGGSIYIIDEDRCIDCGVCEAVCPVNAIIEK